MQKMMSRVEKLMLSSALRGLTTHTSPDSLYLVGMERTSHNNGVTGLLRVISVLLLQDFPTTSCSSGPIAPSQMVA